MTGSQSERKSPGDRTIDESLRQIEDTSQHVGGGTAAALSAAMCAAAAALVTELSRRRRSNRDLALSIGADLDHLQQLKHALLDAAEADERALNDLMELYQRKSTPSTDLRAALLQATESSLAIARMSTEICEVAARQSEIATRFTVSDLGAAASISRGAVIASLLTAETNIRLLDGIDDEQSSQLDHHRSRIEDLEQRSGNAAGQAIEIARDRIRA